MEASDGLRLMYRPAGLRSLLFLDGRGVAEGDGAGEDDGRDDCRSARASLLKTDNFVIPPGCPAQAGRRAGMTCCWNL